MLQILQVMTMISPFRSLPGAVFRAMYPEALSGKRPQNAAVSQANCCSDAGIAVSMVAER